MIDAIGTGEVRNRVVNHATADRIERADIGQEMVAIGDNPAVIVKTDLQVMNLVAGMAGAHEMLAPILDPFHRPADLARQKRNQQILGIDVPFYTEAAAYVRCNAANARLGNTQCCRHLASHPMHNLG
jgi:hypothetical protein